MGQLQVSGRRRQGGGGVLRESHARQDVDGPGQHHRARGRAGRRRRRRRRRDERCDREESGDCDCDCDCDTREDAEKAEPGWREVRKSVGWITGWPRVEGLSERERERCWGYWVTGLLVSYADSMPTLPIDLIA